MRNGHWTDLYRADEEDLYSIMGLPMSIVQEIKSLPRYRRENINKMLRSVVDHAKAVMERHKLPEGQGKYDNP